MRDGHESENKLKGPEIKKKKKLYVQGGGKYQKGQSLMSYVEDEL